MITITNPFGATPPQISQTVGIVKASAGLKAVPPLTASSDAIAPPMTGQFGPGNLQVSTFSASDPYNYDAVFGTGDLIDLVSFCLSHL